MLPGHSLQAVLIVFCQFVFPALIAAPLDDLAEDGPVHFSQEPVGTLSAHTGEGSLQNFQQPFEVLPAAHIGEGPRRYRDECSAVVLSKRSKA